MKKVVLAILDGFGIVEKVKPKNIKCFDGSLISDKKEIKERVYSTKIRLGDAVAKCSDYNFISLFEKYPSTLLYASGEAVGLPKGQMGNSEVGHLNIGAGKVVLQDLLKISKAFEDKSIMQNKTFCNFFENNVGKKLHIVGLVSNGNVHSSIEHLINIMSIAYSLKVKLYIHMITDGRDTSVTSGILFAKKISQYAKKYGCEIASVCGRYYAMDRENNVDRTKLYFDCITGIGQTKNENVLDYIKNSYKNNVTDEFILPCLFDVKYKIEDEDNILFFNFRADRMRQIVKTFIEKTKTNIYTMTEYNKDFEKVNVIFKPEYEKNVLSEIISEKGLKQLKVAEVSKYAHVTYFLNGGREEPFNGEDRVLVDMVDVPTYDMAPKMSAEKVTNEVVNGMKKGYDLICVNYANCDMVGHTGNFDATCMAVKTVTSEVLKLYSEALKQDYVLIVTADHGNADCMLKGNEVCTTHTTNRVPFLLLNYDNNISLKNNGALCNIMPTILEIMK